MRTVIYKSKANQERTRMCGRAEELSAAGERLCSDSK